MDKKTNIDKQKLINAILNSSGNKINQNAINRAGKGDVSGIMASLNEQDRKNLSAALGDPKKAKEILSSKEAREILKNFLGGKKDNG